jgi:WD40 repeat protein
VVTASADHTARLWDAKSGKQLAELKGHKYQVTSAAFSPDGTQVVTNSNYFYSPKLIYGDFGAEKEFYYDRTARLWDVKSGKQLAELKDHTSRVTSAAFSPDGTRVVTTSANTARLWDAKDGKQLTELKGHTGEVTSAAFSPDGTRVVTTSVDNTARLWDAKSGKPVAELKGHEDQVNSATFSPDGTRLVTVSDDKTARLWDALSTQALIDRGRARLPRKEMTAKEKEIFFVFTD